MAIFFQSTVLQNTIGLSSLSSLVTLNWGKISMLRSLVFYVHLPFQLPFLHTLSLKYILVVISYAINVHKFSSIFLLIILMSVQNVAVHYVLVSFVSTFSLISLMVSSIRSFSLSLNLSPSWYCRHLFFMFIFFPFLLNLLMMTQTVERRKMFEPFRADLRTVCSEKVAKHLLTLIGN